MGTKAIDPQAIRNVTIVGDPDDTTRLIHRLLGRTGSGPQTVIHWSTNRIDHTIRLTELSSRTPAADLERSIRVADGVIALVDAASHRSPRLETTLRVADDHQVARLCVLTGLDHPRADFERCIRTIADTRGAVPLTLQIPLGTGAAFDGTLDLAPMWTLAPMAAEFYGAHWQFAAQWYRTLAKTLMDSTAQDPSPALRNLSLEQLHRRIRRLTRIGDVVPVLCSAAPRSDDISALMDAIVRYLPSPLDVCQPEHALDY
ncbi:GTP-binding protein [Nocardia sp. NBC_01327]|uniref:GTP-binding protein n=1 Tax=Nocardia sp. NBC_01327 TaxID=2903593 RepID=UPI002E0ED6D8|nr:GTP-binding protein [Nocardia sp. NBC_01327]